jgi:hypothetical protein
MLTKERKTKQKWDGQKKGRGTMGKPGTDGGGSEME